VIHGANTAMVIITRLIAHPIVSERLARQNRIHASRTRGSMTT
jgi:hypothetical protein